MFITSFGFFRAFTVAIAICYISPWLLIPITIVGFLMFYILKISKQGMIEA